MPTDLKLIFNIKTFIHTQHQNAYTRNIKHCFTIFTIKTKKEQVINLRWKYFHSHDTFYYNK